LELQEFDIGAAFGGDKEQKSIYMANEQVRI
jgi:hypothetical protein